MDAKQRLKILIDSSSPIVLIETLEEARALRLIQQAATELELPVFEWSIADGLSRSAKSATGTFQAAARTSGADHKTSTSAGTAGTATSAMYNTKEAVQVLSQLQNIDTDAVYVLKDIHRQLDDPLVIRMLREAAQQFSQSRRTIIITAPAVVFAPELQNEIEYVDLPLPDKTQLAQIIDDQFNRLAKAHKLQNTLDANGHANMAANLCGLTEDEATRATAEAIIARGGLTPETVTDVMQAKREMLRRSGMLEFIPAQDSLSTVGGLANLKKWLHIRQAGFLDAGAAAGLESPRGVIILGVQGCGKSLCARTIAGEWQLPLVKFDTAAVYDKFIGETEKRIQKVFQVAEQLAPCVLWIDELEKVFAGSGPDSASVVAGVSSRLLASFLSWMQDRKAPVFVAATCNNVSALPPELIRKGRFDELFFVDLPNQAERKQIFSIQLAKRKRNPADYDLDRVAAAARGYSGAEIDAAVQTA